MKNDSRSAKKNAYEANINANIEVESGVPYYRVRLQWVPRVGDMIELYSHTEATKKHYEVVQVEHQINTIDKEIWQSHDGHHHVTLRVKPIAARHPLSKGDLLSLLVQLAFSLNETIAIGKHHGITSDRIRTELERGTIFKLLAELPAAKGALTFLEALKEQDAEIQERLIAEWRAREFNVGRDGLCHLLAYVIGSIEFRTDGDSPWPESFQRPRSPA